MNPALPVDEGVLAESCARRRIRSLPLFGSRLPGTARPDSEVELLAEFEPRQVPGLLGLAGMEAELSRQVGGPAELRTPNDPSRHFRDEAVRTAEVQYPR